MWKTMYSAETKANAAIIWQLWSDVASWNRWDEQIESSRIDGAFVVGSHIFMRQQETGDLPPSELIAVQQGQSFTDRMMFPENTTLDFTHELTTSSNGTHITHSIVLDGPLAEQFAAQIGEGLEQGLVKAVQRLVWLVESQSTK